MKDLKQQFVDWVNKQDPDKEYNFYQPRYCPIALFGQETGYIGEGETFIANDWVLYETHEKLRGALVSRPWTFGALAKRLSVSSI